MEPTLEEINALTLGKIEGLLVAQAKLIEDQTKEHQEQRAMLTDIHSALYGVPKAKIKGIAELTYDNCKYIANDKKLKWTATGMLAVIIWLYYLALDTIKQKLGI